MFSAIIEFFGLLWTWLRKALQFLVGLPAQIMAVIAANIALIRFLADKLRQCIGYISSSLDRVYDVVSQIDFGSSGGLLSVFVEYLQLGDFVDIILITFNCTLGALIAIFTVIITLTIPIVVGILAVRFIVRYIQLITVGVVGS